MDIVLELTDTFIADYAYAYLYPFRPDLYEFPHASAVNTSSTKAFSSWTYKPATQFLQVQPSRAAYMSSLDRDNIYRQLATLFFITWSVLYSVFRPL
jgi:lathosterol oxidase